MALLPEDLNRILLFLFNFTKKYLKISSPKAAIDLLASSERVAFDIYHMLVNQDCYSNSEELMLLS